MTTTRILNADLMPKLTVELTKAEWSVLDEALSEDIDVHDQMAVDEDDAKTRKYHAKAGTVYAKLRFVLRS